MQKKYSLSNNLSMYKCRQASRSQSRWTICKVHSSGPMIGLFAVIYTQVNFFYIVCLDSLSCVYT